MGLLDSNMSKLRGMQSEKSGEGWDLNSMFSLDRSSLDRGIERAT